MKWYDILRLNIYGTSLDDMPGSGITSITSWTMNVHCIRNVTIPMIVALRLILSMMRSGVEPCGVYHNDVTFKARPLCNLMRCTALWKCDITDRSKAVFLMWSLLVFLVSEFR